jgi:hypothetical protein
MTVIQTSASGHGSTCLSFPAAVLFLFTKHNRDLDLPPDALVGSSNPTVRSRSRRRAVDVRELGVKRAPGPPRVFMIAGPGSRRKSRCSDPCGPFQQPLSEGDSRSGGWNGLASEMRRAPLAQWRVLLTQLRTPTRLRTLMQRLCGMRRSHSGVRYSQSCARLRSAHARAARVAGPHLSPATVLPWHGTT